MLVEAPRRRTDGDDAMFVRKEDEASSESLRGAEIRDANVCVSFTLLCLL